MKISYLLKVGVHFQECWQAVQTKDKQIDRNVMELKNLYCVIHIGIINFIFNKFSDYKNFNDAKSNCVDVITNNFYL